MAPHRSRASPGHSGSLLAKLNASRASFVFPISYAVCKAGTYFAASGDELEWRRRVSRQTARRSRGIRWDGIVADIKIENVKASFGSTKGPRFRIGDQDYSKSLVSRPKEAY
jgi:hypothetical protein